MPGRLGKAMQLRANRHLQTVNLPAYAYGGSNPPLPTTHFEFSRRVALAGAKKLPEFLGTVLKLGSARLA